MHVVLNPMVMLALTITMRALQDENCDIAMLAVGVGSGTDRFYASFGFRLLGRPFVFRNVHGQSKIPANRAAMIAPVGSPDLFAFVVASDEPLDVGPEQGYW